MLVKMIERVCIGGCGITGAVTAALLRKDQDSCHVAIWDKSRGSGGRMATSRSPTNDKCTADLGAQYISATTADYAKHKTFYEELELEGVLKPMTSVIDGDNRHDDGTKHYVPPRGMGSLVKHFINKSGGDVKFGETISSVDLEGERWRVSSTSTGLSESYDCVVLTMPTPQILQLNGTIRELLDSKPDIKERLQKVEYSSRYAMGLFFKPGTQIDLPWDAKYFKDDKCIRFVSIDNRKRGIECTEEMGPSLVAHTSVPFGLQYLEGDKDHVCSNMVLPRLRALIPELPPAERAKNHKWRYSQVFKPYEGSPGFVVLHEKPLLLLGGDGFTYSKFDGCLESALGLTQSIIQNSQGSNL